MNLERVMQATSDAYADAINKAIFSDLPFKIRKGKDKRNRLEKIRDYFRWKLGEFRIWLGEKIAGQDFYYED